MTTYSLTCLERELVYLCASGSPSVKTGGRASWPFLCSCGSRDQGTVHSRSTWSCRLCNRSRDHPCSPLESWRRSGCSQRLELISVSDFQRNVFILGLLSLLLLNSGRSILKVMVITSIIFLISFLSEIHFCRVKKEWCERRLISEGKP